MTAPSKVTLPSHFTNQLTETKSGEDTGPRPQRSCGGAGTGTHIWLQSVNLLGHFTRGPLSPPIPSWSHSVCTWLLHQPSAPQGQDGDPSSPYAQHSAEGLAQSRSAARLVDGCPQEGSGPRTPLTEANPTNSPHPWSESTDHLLSSLRPAPPQVHLKGRVSSHTSGGGGGGLQQAWAVHFQTCPSFCFPILSWCK